MTGLSGRNARVRVSGAAVAFADEATTTSDNQSYQIANAAKQVWDRTATITVEEDGVATVESYTVNRLTGTITFDDVDALRGVVTVTGQYLPLSEAATAHRYSHARSRGILTDTAFGATWESHLAGMLNIRGSLARWVIDEVFGDALVAGAILVLDLMPDRSGTRFTRVWALLNAEQMDAAIDGVVDEAVEFTGVHDADGRSFSTN